MQELNHKTTGDSETESSYLNAALKRRRGMGVGGGGGVSCK